MPDKIKWTLQSRKFWAAVVGFVSIIYVAWRSGAALDPDTVVNAILGVVAAYMGATAWEDGKRHEADAATATAATTTITTPSQNVDVSTSETTNPVVAHTGLQQRLR